MSSEALELTQPLRTVSKRYVKNLPFFEVEFIRVFRIINFGEKRSAGHKTNRRGYVTSRALRGKLGEVGRKWLGKSKNRIKLSHDCEKE